MALRFDMRPLSSGLGAATQRFPQTTSQEKINLVDLLAEIEHNTTMTTADALGVITELKRLLVKHLSQGARVKVDGLGSFSVQLQVKKEARTKIAADKVTGKDVEVKSVNFIPDATLMGDLEIVAVPERERGVFKLSDTTLSPDERLAKLKAYLKKNGSIYCADYEKLVGLRKSTALKELNAFAADASSGIAREGQGPRLCFVMK